MKYKRYKKINKLVDILFIVSGLLATFLLIMVVITIWIYGIIPVPNYIIICTWITGLLTGLAFILWAFSIN